MLKAQGLWMGLWATWASGKCLFHENGGWNWVILKAYSNPNHSVILPSVGSNPTQRMDGRSQDYETPNSWNTHAQIWTPIGKWGSWSLKLQRYPLVLGMSNLRALEDPSSRQTSSNTNRVQRHTSVGWKTMVNLLGKEMKWFFSNNQHKDLKMNIS